MSGGLITLDEPDIAVLWCAVCKENTTHQIYISSRTSKWKLAKCTKCEHATSLPKKGERK